MIYVTTDTEKEINAYHDDHPKNTEYLWDIIESDDSLIEIGMIDGEDTNILKLPQISHAGDMKVRLKMSVTLRKIYKFKEKCDIKIIVHDKPIFGIDLGTTYSCIAYQKKELNHN